MSAPSTHELIVRGVFTVGGHVLLCRRRGSSRTFLPGGHIEDAESARTALRREIREELGRDGKVGCFLGVAEHTFAPPAGRVCEVNLVFAFRIDGLSPASAPPSAEPHLEFLWQSVDALAEVGLEPAALRDSLPRWLAAPTTLDDRFVSTYPL